MNVWALWTVAYRDAIVVAPDLRAIDVHNLSDEGLQDEANYQALEEQLIALETGVTP